MSAKPQLLVDIAADIVCPWCHVGLKSFRSASKALLQDFELVARLRPYQLNPATPEAGVDRETYYRSRFPDEAMRAAMRERLIAAASEAGFLFNPSIPTRLPNTALAHLSIAAATAMGAQDAFADALYAAYWERDIDLSDPAAIAGVAAAAGLDGDAMLSALRDEAALGAIRSEADAMRRAGVTGVPTYIVNERTGFSGALPPSRLAAALREAASA